MSDSADSRLERLRHSELRRVVENLPLIGDSTAQWLGIVYAGDHSASPTGHIGYNLCHPAEINGDEDEGSEPTIVIDETQSASVLVLNHAPRVGDLLVVHGIGGRWVAQRTDELNKCAGVYNCDTCPMPQKDLTLSWTNATLGDSSTGLVFTEPHSWKSECVNNVYYELLCASNALTLVAHYFTVGSCPDGTTTACTNISPSPKLLIAQCVCPPESDAFSLDFLTTNADFNPVCTFLYSAGYRQFSVSDGDPQHYPCCFNKNYPKVIFLTDSSTTIPLTSTGGSVWRGCYDLDVGNAWADKCECRFEGGAGTGSLCTIIYQLICLNASGLFTLTRNWRYCGDSDAICGYCHDAVDDNCNIVSETCAGHGEGLLNCLSGVVESVSGSFAPTSISPFAWSGNITLASTLFCAEDQLSSPLGAAVALSS